MMENKTSATIVPIELFKKYDRPGPRYTSYPTVPMWSEDVGTAEYRAAIENASKNADLPLAIYCHIPFCRKRCYYCGCNTCITNNMNNVDDYMVKMIAEIDKTAELFGQRKKVSQIHFGGGTPTFLDQAGLEKILDSFDKHFEYTDKCEKSVELDPRVTTHEQLDFLASRGFNRASLGVQDFDGTVQQAIGRLQSYEQVKDINDYCRGLGFKGINFDLIYGLPKQTVESFKRTLDTTIGLKPDRLAVYSFAYIPDFKSNQARINKNDLPATEVKYKLFAKAIEMFTEAGYRQIGMDHFALPSDELAIAQVDGRLNRNFMGYTVQAAPEMIGFGMSSIGYINNSFFQNISKLDSYKTAIREDKFAIYRGMVLSEDDLIRQYLISSLMCNFVLNFADLKKKFNIDYHTYFAEEHKELKGFFEDNFLNLHPDRLEIAELGRTFVRNIAMTFDAYLRKKDNRNKATFSRTI